MYRANSPYGACVPCSARHTVATDAGSETGARGAGFRTHPKRIGTYESHDDELGRVGLLLLFCDVLERGVHDPLDALGRARAAVEEEHDRDRALVRFEVACRVHMDGQTCDDDPLL